MLVSRSGNENHRTKGRNLPSLPGFLASTMRPVTTSVIASMKRMTRNIVPMTAPSTPTTLV